MEESLFAQTLRALMTDQELSQRALARKIPVDVSHLSRILTGRRTPTKQFAERCEEVLSAPGRLLAALQSDPGTGPHGHALETERVWNVTAPIWGFLGRDGEVEDLRTHLLDVDERGVSVAVINGIPGVGKTQLARAYTEAHRGDYVIGWWVDAETSVATSTALGQLAGRLGAQPQWTPAETIAYLTDILSRRSSWLLVLDNVTSMAVIEDVLPRSSNGNGHVLITSRIPSWRSVHRLGLDPLPIESAARILTADGAGSDHGAAVDLAEELGRLPLALGQAAAYTAQTGISTTDYLALYRDERTRLLDCGVASAYVGSVAAAISLSETRLACKEPIAAQVLQVCALWSGDLLPLRAIVEHLPGSESTAAGLGPVDVLRVLAALRESGLLTVDSADDVHLHRLTRVVVQERIADRAARLRDSVAILAALYPSTPSEPASWDACARLTPHAHSVTGQALLSGMISEDLASLLTRTGRYLLCTGLDFNTARALHKSALDQRRALHTGEHPETARALVHLAVDINELGDPARAGELHSQALQMRQRLFPDDHPDTAHSLDNLANVLHRLQDYDQARGLHTRGLDMRRRLYPGDHPDVAYSLSNLAADLRALGDPAAARSLDEQALAMRERLGLGTHPDVAHSLSNLAQDLHALGDLPAAAALEDRSLRMRRVLYPAGHPQTTVSEERLVQIRLNQSTPISLPPASVPADENPAPR